MKKLDALCFDNTYVRLPGDFYRRVPPTPLPSPYLVSFNEKAAELIGLDAGEAARPEFGEYFTGNRICLPKSRPSCYPSDRESVTCISSAWAAMPCKTYS